MVYRVERSKPWNRKNPLVDLDFMTDLLPQSLCDVSLGQEHALKMWQFRNGRRHFHRTEFAATCHMKFGEYADAGHGESRSGTRSEVSAWKRGEIFKNSSS